MAGHPILVVAGGVGGDSIGGAAGRRAGPYMYTYLYIYIHIHIYIYMHILFGGDIVGKSM